MKLCSNCYVYNDDNNLFCTECKAKFDNVQNHYATTDSYIIICPVCYKVYNVLNEKDRIQTCSSCGNNISNEKPENKKKNSEPCIFLKRELTGEKYEILSSEAFVLGRGQDGKINDDSFQSEYFARNECIIEYNNGWWSIHTENSHGHLYIND